LSYFSYYTQIIHIYYSKLVSTTNTLPLDLPPIKTKKRCGNWCFMWTSHNLWLCLCFIFSM